MKVISLSKELLAYWTSNNTTIVSKRDFLQNILNLSTRSAKTGNELSFRSDCAYIWEEGTKCITMNWEDFNKLKVKIEYISLDHYKNWKERKPINFNTDADRLQKQETEVNRRVDTERSGTQGRTRKAFIRVGHLSYKAVKG